MAIDELEEQELNSVTFFQDSLQLDFNGPVLTLFQWPEVFLTASASLAEGSYAFGEPGYRDALCSQIGQTVSAATFEAGVAIEVEFEAGTIFRSSLRDEDYEGSEAGHFRSGVDGDPLIVF
jgi:hypothetical protein